VIEAAEPVVKFLQKTPTVSNISLGKIDVHLPSTEWRIKVTDMQGGIKLLVRGTNSIQQVMVYTPEAELVRAELSREFGEKYRFV
jgi:hypothetical protein